MFTDIDAQSQFRSLLPNPLKKNSLVGVVSNDLCSIESVVPEFKESKSTTSSSEVISLSTCLENIYLFLCKLQQSRWSLDVAAKPLPASLTEGIEMHLSYLENISSWRTCLFRFSLSWLFAFSYCKLGWGSAFLVFCSGLLPSLGAMARLRLLKHAVSICHACLKIRHLTLLHRERQLISNGRPLRCSSVAQRSTETVSIATWWKSYADISESVNSCNDRNLENDSFHLVCAAARLTRRALRFPEFFLYLWTNTSILVPEIPSFTKCTAQPAAKKKLQDVVRLAVELYTVAHDASDEQMDEAILHIGEIVHRLELCHKYHKKARLFRAPGLPSFPSDVAPSVIHYNLGERVEQVTSAFPVEVVVDCVGCSDDQDLVPLHAETTHGTDTQRRRLPPLLRMCPSKVEGFSMQGQGESENFFQQNLENPREVLQAELRSILRRRQQTANQASR